MLRNKSILFVLFACVLMSSVFAQAPACPVPTTTPTTDQTAASSTTDATLYAHTHTDAQGNIVPDAGYEFVNDVEGDFAVQPTTATSTAPAKPATTTPPATTPPPTTPATTTTTPAPVVPKEPLAAGSSGQVPDTSLYYKCDGSDKCNIYTDDKYTTLAPEFPQDISGSDLYFAADNSLVYTKSDTEDVSLFSTPSGGTYVQTTTYEDKNCVAGDVNCAATKQTTQIYDNTGKYQGSSTTKYATDTNGKTVKNADGTSKVDYTLFYDASGDIQQFTAGDTTYTIDRTHDTYYSTSGSCTQAAPCSISDYQKTGTDQTLKDAFHDVESNRFWQGDTTIIPGITTKDIGQTLQATDKTYAQAQSTLNLFGLTSSDTVWPWANDVDAFFTKNYLGIDAFKSQICEGWVSNENAPSTIAFGPDGMPHAHIEGERQTVADDMNGTIRQMYVYMITFSINPSGITKNPTDSITVKVSVDNGVPVQITQGVSGSDIIVMNGTGNEVRYDGTNAIVRQSPAAYSKVCLDFNPNIDSIDARFKDFLRDGKLCNSFTESESVIPGGYADIGNTITGNWGNTNGASSSNTQNQDNQPTGSVPSSTNNGQPSSGGVL